MCTEFLWRELKRRIVLGEVLLVGCAEILLAERELSHELPVFSAWQVEAEFSTVQQCALEITPRLGGERATGEPIKSLEHCVHVFTRARRKINLKGKYIIS